MFFSRIDLKKTFSIPENTFPSIGASNQRHLYWSQCSTVLKYHFAHIRCNVFFPNKKIYSAIPNWFSLYERVKTERDLHVVLRQKLLSFLIGSIVPWDEYMEKLQVPINEANFPELCVT